MSAQSTRSASAKKKHVTPKRILVPRYIFIFCVVALTILGLVMIYSASSITGLKESGDAAYYVKRQLIALGIGLCLCIPIAALSYSRLCNKLLSYGLFFFTAILLILTYVVGVEGGGMQRWLAIGSFTFQPSELAKVTAVLLAAQQIIQYRSTNASRNQLAILGGLPLAILFLLIVLQDLGTAIVFVLGILVILWLAEFPGTWTATFIGGIGLTGVIAIVTTPYRLQRILATFNPWDYSEDGGYQVIQSFYAFASGGITGVGIGLSKQKYFYLPAAHTDFIYAIIGEELGFIGALAVIILFGLLIYSGYKIAREGGYAYGLYVAGGACAMIGIQAVINMLCVVGFAPVTGITLPFVSYGGSSLIISYILVGLVLSVSFHPAIDDLARKKRETFSVSSNSANRSSHRKNGEAYLLIDDKNVQDWRDPDIPDHIKIFDSARVRTKRLTRDDYRANYQTDKQSDTHTFEGSSHQTRTRQSRNDSRSRSDRFPRNK